MRALLFLSVLVFWFSKEAGAVSNSSPETLLASHTKSVHSVIPEENIKVQTYLVEVGKTLTLPSRKPLRYLVASPEVIEIIEMKMDAIEVKAQKIGSTLIVWWEETGIKSIQITVTRPVKEIERTREIKLQSSKLYQSQRARSFRFFYDSEYSFLEQGKVLPRLTEVRKVYNHPTGLEGNTPLGDLKGNLFYEYRKDQNLLKSVALLRDMWFGFFETDFPMINLLDNYDMTVGRQYLRLSNFGFPGSRYTGFTMVPSLKRTKNPERGRIDVSFFIGRERRGAFLDNQAGTNQRNIKLKHRLSGEKIDFYLWRDGRMSLGSYQKWGGPTDATRSKKNFDMDFDFGIPHFRLKGEGGLDHRMNVAMQFAAIFENSWTYLENGFLRVNPHYNTITGTTLDRGRRGYILRSDVTPLMPIFGSDAVRLSVDADISRDLLSLNQKRSKDFNKKWNIEVHLRLPYSLRSDTAFNYENKKALSFPFTKRMVRERISREFPLNSRWLKRIRFFGISALERYGDAENTSGFNSTRYEVGGGAYVSAFGGTWFSGQYLWNRLDEKEPNPPPDGRTYPGQLVLSGGVSHSFRRLPLHVNLSVRYTDERKTIAKLHQPFPNEDRFEARGMINWKLPYDGVLFLEASAITTQPLTGVPENAEFSLILGTRIKGDTHFYLPQKGTIEGYFFIDKNVNGVRDSDEPGISGYEVWIQNGPRTKTDQTGYYRLRVREGIVKLKATQEIPEGYFFTTLNEHDIELLPKKEVRHDFGVVPQTQIKGRAYLDVNRNLVFDTGDMPMPAVQIMLESGQLAVTSAQGLYSILRVRPGPNSAQVAVGSIPSGYKTVTPIERKFEGMPGDILTFDIVMTVERLVSGYVFEDNNRNGRFDPGEKGIQGIELVMDDKQATTNADGKYQFAYLEPGIRKIRILSDSFSKNYDTYVLDQEINVSSEFFSKRDANFPLVKKIQPVEDSTSGAQKKVK